MPNSLKSFLYFLRFSAFFTCPLFTESATGREVNAVDSENSRNIQSDPWRLFQLDKSLCRPDHDFGKFGTGNLQFIFISIITKYPFISIVKIIFLSILFIFIALIKLNL